ncbi:MAG: hypothetical protein ACTS73_04505 [Arsenophonus sp. NEOnobi-MAG3]
MAIHLVLTDNGKEFIDRLFSLQKCLTTRKYEFEHLCRDLGIEHQLSPPIHSQTNGIWLNPFNGRIENAG